MPSSKKIDLKRDFVAGVYLPEGRPHTPPPSYTLHPAASDNGRLGYSTDVSGFVPNPCSLSFPLVKPL